MKAAIKTTEGIFSGPYGDHGYQIPNLGCNGNHGHQSLSCSGNRGNLSNYDDNGHHSNLGNHGHLSYGHSGSHGDNGHHG